MKVSFYESVAEHDLKFAVIISRYLKQWVFCKHKQRKTFEIPGGHRENGESIEACARRELYEETGAVTYTLERFCDYGVVEKTGSQESFGTIFYAEIEKMADLPDSEIEKIFLSKELPECWTYPEIQPYMIDEYKRRRGS